MTHKSNRAMHKVVNRFMRTKRHDPPNGTQRLTARQRRAWMAWGLFAPWLVTLNHVKVLNYAEAVAKR